MAQEENASGCHYSGGGGGGNGGGRGGGGGSGSCRSKKIKPKKVPQRGLGVAQLEKIISEEQQKESLQAANILAKNAIASPTDAASFLAVQKFRPNLPPFHSSVPPPSPSNLSSPNTLFRHAQSAPNIEMLQESCSVLKHSNAGAGEMGSRAISSPRQDSLPRLWGGQCNNLSVEKQRLDHHGFVIDPQGNLPYELNTPVSPQRSLHFQPPPSSMVQSGISPSSVLSSHLEPPSNQSSQPNNYAPQWSEEDKIVGMKRSYPFTLESSLAPSLLCNFRPSFAASSSRPNELALCSSGYTAVAEPRNKYIRASPLPEQMRDEVIGDDGSLNGDFLTLAPPSSASPCSKLNHNHHSDYECRPGQEYDYDRSQIHQPESSGSVKQPFDFFPIKLPTDPNSSDCVRKGNDDNVDTIDLNLKL